MATNFGTKIAVNAHECTSTTDKENVITYNAGFVVDQSREDISDCKGLRDVDMATKFFGKNRHKCHNMVITSCNPFM